MSDSPTPEPESTLVCDCEEQMRSACEAESFYKEHEGKRYCVLHFPSKKSCAAFEKALQRKLENKDFNFRGVSFSDEVSFEQLVFDGDVDFSNATFEAVASFYKATFPNQATFAGAIFDSDVNLSGVTFKANANFSNCTFNGDSDFSATEFYGYTNFSNSIAGYSLNLDCSVSRSGSGCGRLCWRG